MLLDTHYHLDFFEEVASRQEYLRTLATKEIGLVAQTVTPSAFQHLYENIAQYQEGLMIPSLGFHPWWIQSESQAEEELAIFKRNLTRTDCIGEIGLDFSPKRLAQVPKDLQCAVFEQILAMICDYVEDEDSGKTYILSIHCVKSADKVLDFLERYYIDDIDIVPILHYFNGTSDQLIRHLRMGGYFSIHPNMLQTKKGRAYIQQIPENRLFLETDGPSLLSDLSASSARKMAFQTSRTFNKIIKEVSELTQVDFEEALLENQSRIYGL